MGADRARSWIGVGSVAYYCQSGISWERLKLDRDTDASSKDDDEGLLSSVLADSEVKMRLEQMTADEKTVTVCSLAGSEFTHPG